MSSFEYDNLELTLNEETRQIFFFPFTIFSPHFLLLSILISFFFLFSFSSFSSHFLLFSIFILPKTSFQTIGNKSNMVEKDVQNVSDIIGDWGRWQRNIFIFFFVGAMFSAWNGLALTFYAPDHSFQCPYPTTQTSNETICRLEKDPCLEINNGTFYKRTLINQVILIAH